MKIIASIMRLEVSGTGIRVAVACVPSTLDWSQEYTVDVPNITSQTDAQIQTAIKTALATAINTERGFTLAASDIRGCNV